MLLRLPRWGRYRVRNAALPTARWLLQRGSRASSRGSGLGKSRVRYWRCRTLGYGLRRRSSTSGYGFTLFLVKPPPPKNPERSPEKSGSYVPKGVRYLICALRASRVTDGLKSAPTFKVRVCEEIVAGPRACLRRPGRQA